ncbi:TonB-dependent receptor [bacterium]|nr:TonB-dependent receptor [bacterium]
MNRKIMLAAVSMILVSGPGLPAKSVKTVIEGQVIDAKTKTPLHSANVMISHTTIGTSTDQNGRYRLLNIAPGKIHVQASMIGYKGAHQIVFLRPKRQITVDFELEPTILEMGAVVVTGTATPHLLEDMPVRTEVIPRKLIEYKQATNLAEALGFHTGIRVENTCQNCNASQVRILGMDGIYSQILIDGDPVMSSLAGVYGLEHFPEEMVDQIEIVKGGGSSLYGAGAVAGVINLITRRPMTNQVRIKYSGQSMKEKSDYHVGAVAETVNKTGSSGAYVFGSFRRRNPYDRNQDGFSELGALNHESMGFKWYNQFTENKELLASFHHIHEERRGGNKFDLPCHEAEIAEWIEHWRSGGTIRWEHRPTALLDYHIHYSFALEDRNSYYGGLDSPSPEDRLKALSYYGRTKNQLHIAGFQANYQLSNQLWTCGMQVTRDEIKDETAAETAYHLNEIYSNTGFFLQDNLHWGSHKKIEFVLGARMDQHSTLRDWIVSPRIHAKWNAGKGTTFRLAYTTGFKPPQTYDEDLHLCGIQGDQRIIRNAQNLREEKSTTYSAGYEFQEYLKGIPTMLSFTAFRTRLSDSFTEQFMSKESGIEKWERVNSDGATAQGVELDLGIRPFPGIELRGGLTYIHGRYDSPHEDFQTRRFLRTPDWSGNIQFIVAPSHRIHFFLAGDSFGETDVPHEILVPEQETPRLILERGNPFFQIDLGIIYRVPVNSSFNMEINMGIKNITDAFQEDLDQGPDRDPAYVYGPVQPRTFYLGLKTSI